MARVFVTGFLFPEEVDRLKRAGHDVDVRDTGGPIPREELLAGIADADALISFLTDAIDRDAIAHAESLRIVANVAVGYENVDLDAARQRGLVVTNTPDVLTDATADLTIALILAAARRIVEGDAAVRRGSFPPWGLCPPLLGLEVSGRTLGIVGMGRIGTAVARRAALGFGMSILYHARGRNEPAERAFGATRVPLEQLLEESDIVSLHVPLTEQTHHLIDAAALARMKRSALLINAARGPVVDERALADALRSGRIAGAGLDVYEREPSVDPELLRQTERVVLTPHVGSATEATRRAMARLAVENVLAVLRGDPPRTPVQSRESSP